MDLCLYVFMAKCSSDEQVHFQPHDWQARGREGQPGATRRAGTQHGAGHRALSQRPLLFGFSASQAWQQRH